MTDVTVMLGFPQAASRAMALGARIAGPISPIKPLANGIVALADRSAKGSTGRPDKNERDKATTSVVATASASDRKPTTITLTGPNPYEVTADILAWRAIGAASNGMQAAGAHGPISAFGLDALTRGCSVAGMVIDQTSS